jgi:very-short-patch-repair endonuclease
VYAGGRAVRLRAKTLRRAQTAAEEELWTLLRDRQRLRLKFRRQHPIGPYVADFYCHELKLIVELDGPVHDERGQATHDENRDANLKALGYQILRFTNDEISSNPPGVLGRIANVVKGPRS